MPLSIDEGTSLWNSSVSIRPGHRAETYGLMRKSACARRWRIVLAAGGNVARSKPAVCHLLHVMGSMPRLIRSRLARCCPGPSAAVNRKSGNTYERPFCGDMVPRPERSARASTQWSHASVEVEVKRVARVMFEFLVSSSNHGEAPSGLAMTRRANNYNRYYTPEPCAQELRLSRRNWAGACSPKYTHWPEAGSSRTNGVTTSRAR
jgi:hypothetical protein